MNSKSNRIFIPRFNGKEWNTWRTYPPTEEQLEKWKHPNLKYDAPFDIKSECDEYCNSLNKNN